MGRESERDTTPESDASVPLRQQQMPQLKGLVNTHVYLSEYGFGGNGHEHRGFLMSNFAVPTDDDTRL